MINKENIKGFLVGVTLSAALISTAAFAQNIEKTVTAVYNNIKICVNGNEINPKDVNGNEVEPFIIDGTTYLPVRAIASALGEAVDWDGNTNTVYIGDRGTEKEFSVNAESMVKFTDVALANVGDTTLTGALYNYVINTSLQSGILKNYSDNYSGDATLQSMTIQGQPAAKALSDYVSSQLEQIYALSSAAASDGALNSSEAKDYINASWNDFRNNYSDEDYAGLLSRFSTTDEAIKSFVKGMAAASFYSDSLYDKEESTEYTTDELTEAYNKEFVHVKHILAEDEQTAKEIIGKLSKGTKFDDLMKEYNTDFGEPEDGYTFTKGEMVKEFEDASFALKIGSYTTEPIKTVYGYHIIMRLAIEKQEIEANAEAIKERLAQIHYNNALYEIFEKYPIIYTDKYNEYTSTIE